MVAKKLLDTLKNALYREVGAGYIADDKLFDDIVAMPTSCLAR